MYRPHTEYRHRPYKSNSRSGADIFFVCAQVYVILFTLVMLTRWVSNQPGFQFHKIVIQGNHAVSVPDVERIIRAPMEGKLLWVWRRDNVLLYPTHTVKERIASLDQRIASVAIATTRREVLVQLSEYHPTYRYCLSRLSRLGGNMLAVPTAALDLSNSSSTVQGALATETSSSTQAIVPFSWSASSSLLHLSGEQLGEGLQELPGPDTVGIDTHDCYWADERGYIYAKAPQYSGSPLLTITEDDPSRNETLAGQSPLGTYVFDENDFKHLQAAIDQLEGSGFVLRRIVRMPSSDVIFDIGYPWNLALNIKSDPKNAVQNFFLGLKELGTVATGEKSQLKIIDVRFGNKVFYR